MTYRPLVAALGLALSGRAFAQQAQAALGEIQIRSARELEPTYNLPTASSATKIQAPLRDIPRTVNVVPQSLLRDQTAQSMQDVLKMVYAGCIRHGWRERGMDN